MRGSGFVFSACIGLLAACASGESGSDFGADGGAGNGSGTDGSTSGGSDDGGTTGATGTTSSGGTGGTGTTSSGGTGTTSTTSTTTSTSTDTTSTSTDTTSTSTDTTSTSTDTTSTSTGTTTTGTTTTGTATTTTTGTTATLTEITECATPNVTIPYPSGMTDTITVTLAGTITDVNVVVQVSHNNVGDLTIELQHLGTNRELVNRKCDNWNNIDATFDDEGSTLVCGGTPAISGNVIPEESLDAYDGMEAQGNWGLQVVDSSAAWTGTLTHWCVTISF